MRAAAGTIVAKPLLPYARVLARAFRRHHPTTPFYVLLADRIDGYFEPDAEPFRVVEIEELAIDAPHELVFANDQQPLSYAATPYLLSHLLSAGYERVLFIKQESLVTATLEPVFELLDHHPIVLTPHLLAPPATPDAVARELNILVSGVFNVGLVGVARAAAASTFLDWWKDRVRFHCRHAIESGLHYEQRWLDLVPAYFPEAHFIRERGANVGHWNLPDRVVRRAEDGSLHVDDDVCRLIRFSGFDPDEPEELTRYNRRVRMSALADAASIAPGYAADLQDAGWRETQAWPYAFATFDNGVAIPSVARDLYADDPERARFGNPFSTGTGSFYEWLAGTDGLSPLWLAVHARRPDLQAHFPDPGGADRAAFVAWTEASGRGEYEIDVELASA